MKYKYEDGSKVFFTSDTHFGHKNIIRFCNRPWLTIAEHDQALIQNWNDTVPEDAVVFHLGDFCYKGWRVPDNTASERPAAWPDSFDTWQPRPRHP